MPKLPRAGIAAAIAMAALTVALLARDEEVVHLTGLERSSPAPGIEVVEGVADRGREESRFVAVFMDPTRVVGSIEAERAALAATSPEAAVVVNGGYFTPEGRATGLLYAGGEVINPFVPTGGGAGSGVLVSKGGAVRLFRREDLRRDDYEGATFAIQAGPRIIESGGEPGIRSDDGLRANRTAIGRDRRGFLALAIVYGRPPNGSGVTLHELQRLLGPEGIGAFDDSLAFDLALNLDGGPSTGLVVRGDRGISLPEASRVHNALCFRRTTEGEPP
jgi:exopolysaccharide biosynthesis protein